MKLSNKQEKLLVELYNQFVVEKYESEDEKDKQYCEGKIQAIAVIFLLAGYTREHKKWVKESEVVNNANETSDNLPL